MIKYRRIIQHLSLLFTWLQKSIVNKHEDAKSSFHTFTCTGNFSSYFVRGLKVKRIFLKKSIFVSKSSVIWPRILITKINKFDIWDNGVEWSHYNAILMNFISIQPWDNLGINHMTRSPHKLEQLNVVWVIGFIMNWKSRLSVKIMQEQLRCGRSNSRQLPVSLRHQTLAVEVAAQLRSGCRCEHTWRHVMDRQQQARNRNNKLLPRKLRCGVIYHPVHGYPIAPPVPVAVSRRNARERTRVKTVNDSYQHLKAHVPAAAKTKRMSKVDIIRHSIEYIQKLQNLVTAADDFDNNDHQSTPEMNRNAQHSSDTNCNPPVHHSNYFDQYYSSSSSYADASLLSTSFAMSSSVPVSPSFSTTSSSSNFSMLSSSSVPDTLDTTPQKNYTCDNFLDDDILDVIAEWQDS